MDDVSDFQQRLEQFQKGKQFGSVRSVQMGAIQGGSPFTYYPQGMKAGNDRFRAPNAGISPNFSIGNEKPRYSPNPPLYKALEKGFSKMGGLGVNIQGSNDLEDVQGPVDRSDVNRADEQVDELLGTTAQGRKKSAETIRTENAFDEAAAEMDDRPDMSGKRGFRGGLAVGITDNDRGWTPKTVSEAQGVFVGTAINVAKEAWTNRPGSRAQKRGVGSPAEVNRQRESAKFANPDFDPFT